MAEGFLGRWSQRKQAVREGKGLQEVQPLADEEAKGPSAVASAVSSAVPGGDTKVEPQAPALTLDDVKALTPESDFSRFSVRGIAPEVRNAAMKKLFADPHYNVMDGLDIYIDDYSLASPLPAAMLKKMVSAQFLQGVDEPESEQPLPVTATTPLIQATQENHDHSDLQLQPNHAAEPPEPGRGTE